MLSRRCWPLSSSRPPPLTLARELTALVGTIDCANPVFGGGGGICFAVSVSLRAADRRELISGLDPGAEGLSYGSSNGTCFEQEAFETIAELFCFPVRTRGLTSKRLLRSWLGFALRSLVGDEGLRFSPGAFRRPRGADLGSGHRGRLAKHLRPRQRHGPGAGGRPTGPRRRVQARLAARSAFPKSAVWSDGPAASGRSAASSDLTLFSAQKSEGRQSMISG